MFTKLKIWIRKRAAHALRWLAYDLSLSGVWQAKGDSYDILHFARINAALSTARYYERNANTAQCFANAFDLLAFCVAESKSCSQKIAAAGSKPLFLEFGVHRCRTINHIATLLPEHTVHGFDVFTGLPEDWRTGFDKGLFAVDRLPEVRQNIQLVKGLFSETLPDFVAKMPDSKVALLHVDCDLYSSSVDVFNYLAPLLLPGSIICFDEYWNYPGWAMHEFKAWQEHVRRHRVNFRYIGFVPSGQQVAVRIDGIG